MQNSPNYKVQGTIEVEVLACDKINQSKSLIYIHDYNIPDIDEYCSELKKG